MWTRTFLLQVLLLSAAMAHSQSAIPTFAADIAPIIYQNCTPCHRQGGIGSFALESYADARARAVQMKYATQSRHMPPWPPDASYRRFHGERHLSQTQIDAIATWVDNLTPRGDATQEPPSPTYTTTSRLPVSADTILRIPTYAPTTDADEYRCFVIPSGLRQGRALRMLEMQAANTGIVHHMLLYADTSGQCRQLDDADPAPGYSSFGGVGNANAPLLGGWAPGSDPIILPQNFGMSLARSVDLVLQVHYAPGSRGMADSSYFRMVYHPLGTATREYYMVPILNHSSTLVNGPLRLAAGQIKTFKESFTLPIPITILSIFPHGHNICRDWKVYATNPRTRDTTPLIKIPEWEFHWQNTYRFREPIVLLPGQKLEALSRYDNSDQNPMNPSSPPIPVTAGEGTLDEMMLVYFGFAGYRPGDENLVLDTLAGPTATRQQPNTPPMLLLPEAGGYHIQLAQGQPTAWQLYTADGRLISRGTTPQVPMPHTPGLMILQVRDEQGRGYVRKIN